MNRFTLFLSKFLNRGLDALLRDLTKLDAKLDKYIAAQKAVIDAADAAIERAAEIKAKKISKVEAGYRDLVASMSVTAGNAELEAARAKRVGQRIKALVE